MRRGGDAVAPVEFEPPLQDYHILQRVVPEATLNYRQAQDLCDALRQAGAEADFTSLDILMSRF